MHLHRGEIRRGGAALEGIHLRRRLHAGSGLAAHVAPFPGLAAVAVSGSARPQSVALHVLLRFRRSPCGRRVAGASAAAPGPSPPPPPPPPHPAPPPPP